MDFELTQKEDIKIYGLSVKLTKSQNENYGIITNHWRKFNNELKINRKGSDRNWGKYGLTYKKIDCYFYMPAVLLKIPNPNFEPITISGGEYAKFLHKGDMKLLKTTIYNIYKKIIPNSDLQIDNERILLHYEHYDFRFKWNKNDSLIDIYVPIAARCCNTVNSSLTT